MDKNTQIQAQKTAENNNNSLIPTQKNTVKKPWKFYIFPVIVVIISVWYGGYFRLFATGSPIAPNSVLDPSCAPGDANCFVQFVPQQGPSTAGQVLQ